jgi:ABC-type lipoprotein release transport system permease subunit
MAFSTRFWVSHSSRIGAVAGLYPAMRAARLSPTDALAAS